MVMLLRCYKKALCLPKAAAQARSKNNRHQHHIKNFHQSLDMHQRHHGFLHLHRIQRYLHVH